jgi:hypothetical protein
VSRRSDCGQARPDPLRQDTQLLVGVIIRARRLHDPAHRRDLHVGERGFGGGFAAFWA